MSEFRFNLERYMGRGSRYECPSCAKQHEFTRYIDTSTGLHLHPTVGICNRQNKCGYHYGPSEYFYDNNIKPESMLTNLEPGVLPRAQRPKAPSYIPEDLMWRSVQLHAPNHYIEYLSMLFGNWKAQQLAMKYRIGTSTKIPGGTVFWQVDSEGNTRGGKVMLYDPVSGRRDKKYINWVHSLMGMKEYNLRQCLFGEHLLDEDLDKPVAVVESEKTAIIASIYCPQYVWVAVGGLQGLKAEKLKALAGREVTLFPDLGGYLMWSMKAQELSYIADFTVSDALEKIATDEEKVEGLDLADYLVRYDSNCFL